MELLPDLQINRVLSIFAHPDDAEVAAGGTLAKFAHENVEVYMLTIALGDKGKGDTSKRLEESQQASKVIKAQEVQNLGYKDGEFDNDLDLRKLLTEKIREIKPDLVICPDPTAVFFSHSYVNNRDHRQTGWAVLDVVSSAVGNSKYFSNSPAHSVSHLLCAGSLDSNCVVDISKWIDRKIEAVICHQSQIGNNIESVRNSLEFSSREIGKHVGVDFGEAYRYCSLSGINEQV